MMAAAGELCSVTATAGDPSWVAGATGAAMACDADVYCPPAHKSRKPQTAAAAAAVG